MSRGIFIVGTGTDIGKTYITALINKKLLEDNINATYYKAVLSGAEYNGESVICDASVVLNKQLSSSEAKKHISYIMKTPASPHLASKIEGVNISLTKIKEDFNALLSGYDYITVEGSGGVVCPIVIGDRVILLEDIIRDLNLKTILVADAGLGTINSTVLTVHYMKDKGIEVKGIILNNYNCENIIHRDNVDVIEKLTGIKIIDLVERNGNINLSSEELISYYGKV